MNTFSEAEQFVLLTNEILEAGMSRNGGWSSKQLKVLGVEFTKLGPKPWRQILLNKPISLAKVGQFISLKDKHLD